MASNTPSGSFLHGEHAVTVRQKVNIKGYAAFLGLPPASLALRRSLGGNHFAGDQVFQAGEIPVNETFTSVSAGRYDSTMKVWLSYANSAT